MKTQTPIKPIRVGKRERVEEPRAPRHVKGTMVIVENPRSSNIFLGVLKGLVFLVTVVGVMGAFGAGAVYLFFSFNLPQVGAWKPKVDTKVYAHDGTLIGDFHDEIEGRREPVPLSKIPPRVIKAFLAAEDAEFFDHEGFNIVSIGRALVENLRAGRTKQGGSTITQQVAKGYFSKERALKRKVRELIVASRMERQFTKEEILSRYLNGVYLGHGASGVEAASQNYFGKSVRDLTLGEAAMLAGLPQAPSEYSPAVNPDAAKQQQKKVLERGVRKGFFTREEADAAMDEQIEIHKERADLLREVVPYYTEHVRRDLEQRYGKDLLYGGGLRVETAVDVRLQLYAQDAIVAGMINMDKKEGWRGAWMKLGRGEWPAFIAKQKKYYGDLAKTGLMPGRVYLGLVTGIGARGRIVRIGDTEVVVSGESARWTGGRYYEGNVIDVELADGPKKKPARRLKKDERPPPEDKTVFVTPFQEPAPRAAIYSIDAEKGYVVAMEGGYDFDSDELNRSVQSCRPAGSSFKPIYYSAAIEKGYHVAQPILDIPRSEYDYVRKQNWTPGNIDEEYAGEVTLARAIIASKNSPSIRVFEYVGIQEALDWARRLGISTRIAADKSSALGSSCVRMADMVRAFAAFNRGGTKLKPIYIRRVIDAEGRVIEDHAHLRDRYLDPRGRIDAVVRKTWDRPERVMKPTTAYIMTYLLQAVATRGTGYGARKIGRPVAGKTGTHSDHYDVWFVGFTKELVTAAWMGHDLNDRQLAGFATGGNTAIPIWLSYMSRALKGQPARSFPEPGGIVWLGSEAGRAPFERGNEPKAEDRVQKPGTATAPSVEDPSRVEF